ncbi:MupA/Atu3671 family FMN-dependent luciferase-like monooxygenase [Albidovulum sediminis]|uniref:LLM class flavin-dependent oxidoreductase n=1 Tax=Albidovulum sediminis TaxID=3066345 RepID=A0ABT2NMI3_9RHOB|nr:MupA/Atu3671 family FMN-dependent luciferase-like monooxygenase [Defluviimonas sediminis]MCT8330099.1 LLM class flavin-dependent oxidoreductase [Defluviimonas sediminis]
MTRPSALFVGSESLTIQCAELWIAAGNDVVAVVTRSPDVARWARDRGLRADEQSADVADRLEGAGYDWLFSVANLHVLPKAMVAAARNGAINFHDGPLPRHAGLNAPVWALLQGETHHGIAWHLIEGGIDEGAILEAREFDIGPAETALTLNTRCFEAAIESFGALVASIGAGTLQPRAQDLTHRTWHGRDDRPRAAAVIDFAATADNVARFVRALDHGGYWNPLAVPKIAAGGRVLAVGAAEPAQGEGPAGLVLSADDEGLAVACGQGAVMLSGLRDMDGRPVSPRTLDLVGQLLSAPADDEAAALTEALAAVVRGEGYWRERMRSLRPVDLPLARPSTGRTSWRRIACDIAGGDAARGAVALALFARAYGGGEPMDLAFHLAGGPQAKGYLSDWVPLRAGAESAAGDFLQAFRSDLASAVKCPAFACDLVLRDPSIGRSAPPAVALNLGADAPVEGSVVTLSLSAEGAGLHFDAERLDPATASMFAARISHLARVLDEAQSGTGLSSLPPMPDSEAALLLKEWNRTDADFDPDLCIHRAFEAQVARTPDAVALIHEGESLTYRELNERANRVAHVLGDMGVGPGTLVGLSARRSPSLLVGALAIQKAGGAYVPLDPAYPADRIALYVEDSGCPVIVTESALAGSLPASDAVVLTIDDDPRLGAAGTRNPEVPVAGTDLAYMIYTSGSTGRPKGVMIEHRNVQNFFVGMDAHVRHDPPGTWLAVTSLSFDISVLELFWTLARGFRVVIMGDADRAMVSGGAAAPSFRGMEFSLYYWGNDDGVGPAKYDLLLEGAKFADRNGFCAVWTPERHFHAFGGPYPNPSVTGAAVAAVTQNLSVRAGSCVAPLHHPARIAEEWAVIDNLTSGRAGLAIASGWQPDDFVLRPENTPPANKAAMFDAIDKVRRLWRGEAVEFPTASGKPFAVVTQPRPVSREVPIWVTTAGNPETWREAGAVGANVLTHLLGQSVEEVAGKIRLYHQALRDAGHDPARHTVTLMLHTYVAADRDAARETARGPMKDYLRSAAGLIKQYAWAFPAFKKPQGVTNPMDIDLRSLSEEELEGVLDFAFQRYFEDSGLFGTVEDCLVRVEELKRIGVGEIACLIDYGIPVQTVLDGLVPLAEVLRRANDTAPAEAEDYSIAAQIARHGVTHLQCTPSMARMLVTNAESRLALGGLTDLMIGGEALPGALVADLSEATRARLMNMYGPTETTIWSAVGPAESGAAVAPVGHPVANTRLYVLDPECAPVPLGVAGELWIGGDGVARGYWKRDDLTEERFRPDPFNGGRMYRTGDLVRQRADGRFDFLGRLDHQVKIRGYRIELGEIEAAAEAAPFVRQAVVVAREDVPGDLRLVVYVTAAEGFAAEGLAADLKSRLPAHMVPAHVVRLPEMPLTPNGKVDRKALPAPSQAAAEVATADFVPPAAGVEETIAGIWCRILNLPKVGAEDNFFALGGHSLLAVQAHRDIRAALGGTKLSITDIFRFPTLSALARHLDARPANAPGLHMAAVPNDRAAMRADAMSKRRALRAGRGA